MGQFGLDRGITPVLMLAFFVSGCGDARITRATRALQSQDGPLPTLPGGVVNPTTTTTTTSRPGGATTTTSPGGATTTTTTRPASTTTTTIYVPGPLPVSPVQIPGPGTGALIHVDSNVASSGSGTAGSPFKTIQEGINAAQIGDVVVVHGDTAGPGRDYIENLTFPRAGVAGNPITLRAEVGERVIVSHTAAINFGRDHLLIKGLIFDHRNAASDALRVGGKNVTFDGIEARNGQRDGFEVLGSSENTIIANSKIHDFQWFSAGGVREDAHCVVTNPGAKFFYLLNNEIFDCTGDCIQFYGEGSTPFSSYIHDVLVFGNHMYTTMGSQVENAIDVKGMVRGVIRANDIHGFTANKAIVFQKGLRDALITENFIHGSQRGLEIRREDGKSPSNVEVTRNVFYRISGLSGTGSYAIKTDGLTNGSITHNTVIDVTGNAFRSELGGLTNGVIRNNVFFNAAPPSIKDTWVNNTVSHNGWFSASPTVSAGVLSGAGDVYGPDPLLDAAFKPTFSSPVIDEGVSLGAPFNGTSPDLGAKEF